MPQLPGGVGDRQPSGSAANVVKQRSSRGNKNKQNEQYQQQQHQDQLYGDNGDDQGDYDDNNEGVDGLGRIRRPEENIEFDTPFLDENGPQFNNSFDYDGKEN
jgi:hypothetical protein